MSFLNHFLRYEFKNSSYFKYTLPIKNYYLVKWLPKSKSTIHNHDGKQCNFMLLNGSLTECRYLGPNIGSLIEVNKIKSLLNDMQNLLDKNKLCDEMLIVTDKIKLFK